MKPLDTLMIIQTTRKSKLVELDVFSYRTFQLFWVKLPVKDFIPKRQPSTRPAQYFWMWSMISVHDHSKKRGAPPAMFLANTRKAMRTRSI